MVFDGLQVNDSSPIIEHISEDVVKASSKMMKKHSGLFTSDTEKWGEWRGEEVGSLPLSQHHEKYGRELGMF